MPIEPYEKLAKAVVWQAVKDYRAARKKLKKRPDNKDAQDMLAGCEEFFLSHRFKLFTDIDGERLLHKLQEEKV